MAPHYLRGYFKKWPRCSECANQSVNLSGPKQRIRPKLPLVHQLYVGTMKCLAERHSTFTKPTVSLYGSNQISTMGSKVLLTLSDVNKMPYPDFIETFGSIVEHCALCAAAVCRDRPFTSFNDLNNAFAMFMDDLPLAGKEGILRLHPDLAGRLAMAGQLTSESSKEQAAAGLDKMSEEERKRMSKLNTQYKEKFGFPFVICARMNKKDAILKGLESRLANISEHEAVTGTNEVKKIACLRLKDIVDENSAA